MICVYFVNVVSVWMHGQTDVPWISVWMQGNYTSSITVKAILTFGETKVLNVSVICFPVMEPFYSFVWLFNFCVLCCVLSDVSSERCFLHLIIFHRNCKWMWEGVNCFTLCGSISCLFVFVIDHPTILLL